jgi:hypothetical protein
MPPRNQTRLEPPMSTMNPGELDVDDARVAELVVEAGLGQPSLLASRPTLLGWSYQVARALYQGPQHTATVSSTSSCSSRQWPPATRARTSTNAATTMGDPRLGLSVCSHRALPRRGRDREC